MTILADPTGEQSLAAPAVWVIGVDTHTDTHTDTHDAVLVDALGGVLAQTRVETTPAGHALLLAWAQAHVPAGQQVLWAVEGSRSHGHGLTRHLQTTGYRVVEAAKPVTAARRRGGKSDLLDAVHAARTALTAALRSTHRTARP